MWGGGGGGGAGAIYEVMLEYFNVYRAMLFCKN